MTSISYIKGNNQNVCPPEPVAKQKKEYISYSMKNPGYREEDVQNRSGGNNLAGID